MVQNQKYGFDMLMTLMYNGSMVKTNKKGSETPKHHIHLYAAHDRNRGNEQLPFLGALVKK